MSDDEGKVLRIKMPSGKIYGPYSRADVLKFIRLKKIQGEEEMLSLEEGRWRVVSSDPEFFDQIQSTIEDRTEKRKKTARTAMDQDTKVDRLEDALDEDSAEATRVTGDASLVTKTFMPFSEDIEQLEGSSVDKSGSTSFSDDKDEKTEVRENPLAGKSSSSKGKRKTRVKGSRPLVFSLVALGLLGLFLLLERPRIKELDAKGFSVTANSQLHYFNALNRFGALGTIDLNLLPGEVSPATGWSLPLGFGAHVWIQDLVAMEKEEALFSNSTFWARRVWNLFWVSETIGVADRKKADVLRAYGEKILDRLNEKSLLDEEQRALLSVIPVFAQGKWSEARKILSPLEQDQYVAWLLDEISFIEFIDKGRNKPAQLYIKEYGNPYLDIQSKLRKEMLEGAQESEELLEQLAEFDPQSFVGNLSAAEYYWRASASGIPKAQQAFLSLLSIASLYPMAFQAVAWKEYSQFQGIFGRDDPQKKALENFKLLLSGDVGDSKEFWDLESEGLSVSNMSGQIIKKLERKASNLLDIAFLENLSFALDDPSESLIHVIHYGIFYNDWQRASRDASFILQRDPSNVEALGSKIWIDSANFRFDEAYQLHDKMVQNPKAKGDSIKYEGIILTYGRDFDAAVSTLQRYRKNVPNDGMGHYFLAKAFFEVEKNHDCVKAANLGRIHGRGAIRFLSELLYYRCRILAKLPMSEAIRELGRATKADPQNVFIAKEYVFALYEAGKTQEALEVAKDYVRRVPHAYQLKVLLGSVYERMGKWDEALLFYNDAKKVRPGATEASVRIADMFFAKERYIEAAQNYLSAARNDPDYPDLYLKVARSYRKGGDRYKALEFYKRELDLRPSVLRNFLEAAEFMLEINLPQQVPELFQKYEDTISGDPRVMLRLSQAYWAMQDVDNAEKTAKLVLAKNNKVAEAYRILGRVYDRMGQYGLAKDNFEKYLHLFPQADDAAAIRARLTQPPYYR
ncbi:tetratricopeptide repeat protein [bacterium]|nr:tetratricopeptide repeat protein [bacterium]